MYLHKKQQALLVRLLADKRLSTDQITDQHHLMF
jgi:hypothetical protein